MGKEHMVVGKQLVCTVCNDSHFDAGRALLDSKGKSFLHLDWTNPNADTFACATCRSILWFLGSEGGKEGSTYEVSGQQMHCPICRWERFTTRQTLLSSRGATLIGVDWVNPSADNFICTQCGFVLWFLPQAIGQQGQQFAIADHPLACAYCTHTHFMSRQTLLDGKIASLLKIDWTRPEVTSHICTTCGFIHWSH